MTEVKTPFIKDKVLFSAVSFAKRLIGLGEPMDKWLNEPAKYYKVDVEVLRAEMIRQGFEDKMKEVQPAAEPKAFDPMDEIFGSQQVCF